jgi:N-methylhydantoinase A
VVNVESAISGAVDKPARMTIAPGNGAHSALRGTREMIFDASGIPHETPVYDGAALGAGDRISGPAVIQEVTTTLVIEPGWLAELDATGVYILTLGQEAGQPPVRAAAVTEDA